MRWILIGALALLALILLGILLANWTATSVGGLENGRLKPCPNTPNCVSSQQTDGPPPLSHSLDAPAARQRLDAVMQEIAGAELVEKRDDYLHYRVVSRLFRFADDVEFLFDDASKQIHFRSASRVGYSDLGVNRARMESIRAAFEEAQ